MKQAEKRLFKDQLYARFAELGKALSNGHRLELLELLAQGERSVEALATETDLSIANASQHLQVLRAAGLVKVRRQRTFIYYCLAENAFKLWQTLRDFGQENFADVEKLLEETLTDRRELEPVGFEELRSRLKGGNVVLLDVRPAEEYQAAHLPKAKSLPLNDFEQHLSDLNKKREIIAYCRGPFCLFADEAVSVLRKRGFKARRLELGLPDWQSMGYPVARGIA